MKKKFRLYVGFLLMASGVCAMTACSGGEDSIANTTGGSVSKTDEVLTLTINTGNVSSRATDITGPATTDENTINKLNIGLFDANNGIVGSVEEHLSTGNYPFTQTGNNATVQVVTTTLASKVLVAVNAPKGTDFSNVKTVNDFNDVVADAEKVLTQDQTGATSITEINKNIPMFGSANITGTSPSLTATVPVYHLLAKVTLANLSTDFKGSYDGASFTPKALFLINVPKTLYFNSTAWANHSNAVVTDLFHGWGNFDSSKNYEAGTANTNIGQGSAATISTGDFAQYLTTSSSLSSSSFAPTLPFSDQTYTLYAMPNGNAKSNKKNTKLVIGGVFKMPDGTESICYYPVNLNVNGYAADGVTANPAEARTDAFKVYPNKNYSCTVVLKTKGYDTPYDDTDPQVAQITIQVQDFVKVNQSTTFE